MQFDDDDAQLDSGHHVPNLTGALSKSQNSQQGANSGAVRVEHQADCYAGLWAHYATTAKDADGRVLIKDLTKQDVSDGPGARLGGAAPELVPHRIPARRLPVLRSFLRSRVNLRAIFRPCPAVAQNVDAS